jgi:hypothetical protein
MKDREIPKGNPDAESEPSIWKDAWQRIGRRRHFVHREIGDPVDKSFVQVRIAIRETPMSGGNCQHNREGGQRRSGVQLSA